jgi:hypothetical protein
LRLPFLMSMKCNKFPPLLSNFLTCPFNCITKYCDQLQFLC